MSVALVLDNTQPDTGMRIDSVRAGGFVDTPLLSQSEPHYGRCARDIQAAAVSGQTWDSQYRQLAAWDSNLVYGDGDMVVYGAPGALSTWSVNVGQTSTKGVPPSAGPVWSNLVAPNPMAADPTNGAILTEFRHFVNRNGTITTTIGATTGAGRAPLIYQELPSGKKFVEVAALNVNNASQPVAAPTIGTATIGAGGLVVVNTTAVSAGSFVFVSEIRGAGIPTIPAYVVQINAGSDIVLGGDANAVVQWWIINGTPYT